MSNRNGTGSWKLIWRNCGCSGFSRKFRSPATLRERTARRVSAPKPQRHRPSCTLAVICGYDARRSGKRASAEDAVFDSHQDVFHFLITCRSERPQAESCPQATGSANGASGSLSPGSRRLHPRGLKSPSIGLVRNSVTSELP